MPEHVHILIQPTSHEVRMDLFLKMKKTLVGYDQWHPQMITSANIRSTGT